MTPRRADIAGWAAVVRLKRATERYIAEVTAAMPEIARMAARHDQLAHVADSLIEATDTPASMGSLTHVAAALREVELPLELFTEE